MYAVIRTGGKQYRVEAGQRLRVEKLSGAAGDRVEFPEVLMIGGDGETAVGTPTVEDAHVVGEIVEQGRSRKVTVFKYKNKTRYRRVRGHRQQQTVLAITEIRAPDGRSASYEVRRPGAPVEEAAEVAAEAPADNEPVATEAPAPAEEAVEAVQAVEAAEPEAPAPAEEAAPAVEPESAADRPARSRKTAAKKTAAKKTAAKKTAAKKTTAKKTAAKKTAAKKASATKAAAKKATAKKTAAKKTSARKSASKRPPATTGEEDE
ncbi:MAG: 50S ribosomal protein L21 [Chloroflexi bacterium]|nr:50S ribosomal protein L21 [Chloroflexota bacterium]